MTTEQMRSDFEAEINIQSRRRNEVGDYVLPSIQDRWSGFQAGWQARHNRTKKVFDIDTFLRE